jgi:hypothetical protein
MDNITKGSIIIAQKDRDVCEAGEQGVCADILNNPDGGGATYIFYFENTGYEGFTADKLAAEASAGAIEITDRISDHLPGIAPYLRYEDPVEAMFAAEGSPWPEPEEPENAPAPEPV